MSSNDPSGGTASAPSAVLAGGFIGNGGASGVLGITLIGNEQGHVRVRLAWRAELSRSTRVPSLHAGAIITAIDSAMGMSGMQFMQGSSGLATLDFRYDEFSAPAERADVLIEARCERLDGDILFITGACRSADGESVHARATGRFIRTAGSTMQFSEMMLAAQQRHPAQRAADEE